MVMMIRLSVTTGEAQSNRGHYGPGIFVSPLKNRIYNYKANNSAASDSQYKSSRKNLLVGSDRKNTNPVLKIGADEDQELTTTARLRRTNSNQVDLSSKKVLGNYPDFLDRAHLTNTRHLYYSFALGKSQDTINTNKTTMERMALSIDNQKLDTPNNGGKIFSPSLRLNQTQDSRTQEDLIFEKLQKIMGSKVDDQSKYFLPIKI